MSPADGNDQPKYGIEIAASGVSDMTQLEHLHEAEALELLEEQFRRDEFRCGIIVGHLHVEREDAASVIQRLARSWLRRQQALAAQELAELQKQIDLLRRMAVTFNPNPQTLILARTPTPSP